MATLYYVVYPAAASAPSAAQVKAGQQQSGAAATASGSETARTTTGEQIINGAQQSVSRGLTTYPATIGGSGANLRIGGTDHETDVRPSDDIAWASVWLSALSGTTIGYLAAGRNPMNYSPAFCVPLKGDSPEVDLVGGVSGSVTGTSSVSGPAIDPWLSLPSMSSITATTGVPRVTLTF